MQINIYYGGRGLMDDPTLFEIKKMKEVLEELRVTVEVFYLYEQKNSIPTLPQRGSYIPGRVRRRRGR